MESEDKIGRVPEVRDMLLELRRKPHEEARALLAKWIKDATDLGYHDGLSEGLKRGREGTTATTLADLLRAQSAPRATGGEG